MAIKEFPHRFPFRDVGLARKREAVSGVDLFHEFATGGLDDARSEALRPFHRQFAVEQVERLQWRGGDVAARTAFVGVGHVEAFKKRVARVSLDEDVNASPVPFRFVPGQFPAAVGGRHAWRQFRKDTGAAHFQVEQARHLQRGVANFLSLESLARETPEQFVLRVGLRGEFIVARRLPVSAGGHDEAVHFFDAPAAPHKFGCQKIQQVGVSRAVPSGPEIARRADDAAGEMILPDAVDHHARGERIVRVGENVGQLGPATAR